MADTTDRPDILVLMTDQQRGDCLGCAGHPVVQTPNMDRIAAEGVHFTGCCTTAPLCMPSRASFVSGTYAHNHGLWNNAGRLPAHDETLFHHLQRGGYRTAHVGKSHYYVHGPVHMREWEPYMHARGLDRVHETTGPYATVRTESYMTDEWQHKGLLEAFRDDYQKRRETAAAVWPSPLPVEDFLDSYIGRQAGHMLQTYDEDKPLCLFIGFGGPHPPWDAPGEYATMYDPDDMPAPIPAAEPREWLSDSAREYLLRRRQDQLSEADFRRMAANYFGKISLIDHWIGQILEAQGRRGRLDDTVIVFWSDHGEMLGDHGRLSKSVFFESALRVPLIIRWPGQMPAGLKCPQLVQEIDVFATLLEGLGLQPSERALGRSLWPVIRGGTQERDAEVLSEVGDHTMIRTQRCKYVVDDHGEGVQLYDLAEDPQELTNLCGRDDMRQVEAEMRDRLLRFLARTQCVRPYPTSEGIGYESQAPTHLKEG